MSNTIQIQLNGEPHELRSSCTVQQLITELGFSHGRVAIELNKEILPRGEHGTTELVDNDRIEIIHAIGGG